MKTSAKFVLTDDKLQNVIEQITELKENSFSIYLKANTLESILRRAKAESEKMNYEAYINCKKDMNQSATELSPEKKVISELMNEWYEEPIFDLDLAFEEREKTTITSKQNIRTLVPKED